MTNVSRIPSRPATLDELASLLRGRIDRVTVMMADAPPKEQEWYEGYRTGLEEALLVSGR